MQLAELQQLFCQALYRGDDTLLLPHMAAGGVAVEVRLAVYRNTVLLNLRQALKMAYPVVVKLVGEDFFNDVASCYFQAYPSTSGNLEAYGAHMALFLADFPAAASLPYLPDVARLEWACHEAYHAADAGRIAVEQLMQVPPESYGDLCFSFHPSCWLLASAYPLYRIWQVNQEGYEGECVVDLGCGASCLLVRRDEEYNVTLREISRAEYRFLAALYAGKTLYEAFEEVEKTGAGFNLSEAIRKNVAESVFIAYNIKS